MIRVLAALFGLFLLAPAQAQMTNIVNLPAIQFNGSIPTSPGTGNVTLQNLQGSYGTANFIVTGTWTGTLVVEATGCDATSTVNAINAQNPVTGAFLSTITTNGNYIANVAGYCAVRLRGNTVGSGTAVVTIVAGYPLSAPVGPTPTVSSQGQPIGATQIQGNATGTTAAVTGTLAGTAGKTTYICGFSVSAIGGTAAVGPITIANLVTASQVYQLASSAGGSNVTVTFSPCIPANAANTSITTTTTADGTATAVDVNSWGYQL